MKNIFTIKEKYLIFREQARHLRSLLLKEMKRSGNGELFLDFSRVIFISRSFADELLNTLSEFTLNKKHIRVVNQKREIKILFNAVKKTKEKIRKELFSFSHNKKI